MTTNFKPAKPTWCVINTVYEMDNVFNDTGVKLDFHTAIDSEYIAVDVVETLLVNLAKNNA